MSSEIRVNKINNRSGLSTVTFTNTGPIISGVTTFQDKVDFESNGLNVTSGSVGIGTDNPQHQINTYDNSSTGGILVQNALYGSNINKPYLIAGTQNHDGTTSNWGTFGFQHRIKSNSGGVGRVTIDTANGEALCVNNTHKVGLGTDTPIMRLHVHGAANSADSRIRLSSIEGSGLTIRAQSATENNINADSGEDITFSRGNVESLRITSSGLVGIGTDDPQTGLHIDSTTNAQSRITISKSGFLRNNFIGIDGDADELVIAADESNEGPGSHIRFKVDGTEELRIDSNGLKFNGDTAAANALDDYEQGTITTWRLKKSDANTNGSNHSDTHIRYTKIGQCVYVSGYLRTDSTESARSGDVLLVTVADATVAATLPFTPNHSGGIPIIHTRSIDELDHPISLAFVKDSATIYIYANESTGDYVADSNTLSTNSQTNLVITFSGHFFTDS